MKNEAVSLRFKQGSADKVYYANLGAKLNGYVVNFAYGRYNKALKSGTKTACPIPYEQAKLAYDKLVKAKIAKGYTPQDDGTPFTAPQIDQERTDLFPQLLNAIELDDLPEVFKRFGGAVAMQIKHDGERRLIQVINGIVTGSNRRALKCGLHPRVVLALQDLYSAVKLDFILDCEDMGDYVVAFDVIHWGHVDLRKEPFSIRLEVLKIIYAEMINLALDDVVQFDIPTFYDNFGNCAQDIHKHEAQGEEGVVLRDPAAEYSIGRPNSWGPCLKLKFWESATCIVYTIHPTKRSIGLGMYPQGFRMVGNCTIPANYPIPDVGDLVEIKYLYAYRGGSLYQPQYKGVRTDLSPEAASEAQLKYRE